MENVIELSLFIFLVCLALGFAAGLMDSIAGGGGLLTLPVLLIIGFPPINALATNKFQGVVGVFFAFLTMLHNKVITLGQVTLSCIIAFIFALIGTIALQFIDKEALEWMIPAVIVLIGLYLVFARNLNGVREPKISEKTWNFAVVPSVSFYDGFLGPGTGAFFTTSSMALRGTSPVKATGLAKALNFSTNIGSLIVFISGGHVVWQIGGIMIIGQIFGAIIGSRLVISHGISLIRPVILFVCFIMLARFMYMKFFV